MFASGPEVHSTGERAPLYSQKVYRLGEPAPQLSTAETQPKGPTTSLGVKEQPRNRPCPTHQLKVEQTGIDTQKAPHQKDLRMKSSGQ